MTPHQNTFLVNTLLRAICPPQPWAEIIALAYTDPATAHASPPSFPPSPQGGPNIAITLANLASTPITTHHITLNDIHHTVNAIINGSVPGIDPATTTQLAAGMNGHLSADQLDTHIPNTVLHLAATGTHTTDDQPSDSTVTRH